MCGIAGYYSWGTWRPSPTFIKNLLLANEERGKDASGMAWENASGQIYYKKGPLEASKFLLTVQDSMWEEICKSPRLLLHTRRTTKGPAKDNENNHPIVGHGWVVTHNGTVTNDDDLWDYYEKNAGELKRFAAVDSSIIPLLLSQGASPEESVRRTTLLEGSATFAAWAVGNPDTILLARYGFNDLHLFLDRAKNAIFWSSSPAAGTALDGEVLGGHKFLTYCKIADCYLWLIQPSGVRAFKAKRNPFTRTKRVTYTNLQGVSKLAFVSKNTQLEQPPATTAGVKPEWWDLQEIEQRFRRMPVLMFSKSETPYGTWAFAREPNEPDKLRRSFTPLPTIKKWFDDILTGAVLIFPAKLEEDGTTVWDGYLQWNEATLHTTYLSIGKLCPWCGAFFESFRLGRQNFRCELCHIKSDP